MATILDVARMAGVSKSTVSRFLNEAGPVNAKTADKIRVAISELKYSPNYFAQGMRTSRTRTIGIVIPDYANPFYPELLKGIEIRARESGYMTQICNTDMDAETEYDRLNELVRRQIDGIVLCSYNRIPRDLAYLADIAKQIPVVIMDPVVKNESLSYVITDGYTGTVNAVSYLVSLGRKRIAYIKGPDRLYVTKERCLGYRDALTANGLEYRDELVYAADFSMESGYRAAEHFHQDGLHLDALMAATDLMAIGAIKYFNQAGIDVPGQVAVVGFDNISLCEIIVPSLSTIAQPIGALGRAAAEIIIDSIETGKIKKRRVVMDCELVIRDSTAI
jgi:LacI family transcriptional regulator